jgi:SAM-dependent methyltransferase
MPGVVTPGWFDLRRVVDRMPWPDVKGKRCLDLGAFDGFLAFEMARRGAAQVMAIDVEDHLLWDWPPDYRATDQARDPDFSGPPKGAGFRLAKELIGSGVEWKPVSVYDLTPDLLGTFDVVMMGSLLIHLRDPIRALEAIRGVVADGRYFLSTTSGGKESRRTPDLLDRDFTAVAPNRKWVTDFTYTRTWSGFVYLAFVVDCFSRAIVGWLAQPLWAAAVQQLEVGFGQRFSGTTVETLVADLRLILGPQYATRAHAVATQMIKPAKAAPGPPTSWNTRPAGNGKPIRIARRTAPGAPGESRWR